MQTHLPHRQVNTRRRSVFNLHRYQEEVIRVANSRNTADPGENYVLTTGTGSGKSLSYIIPIVDYCLRVGPRNKRTKAIIIYPMNALANSQMAVIFDTDFEVDGDDACPGTHAPHAAQLIRNVNLPIPPAVTLARWEYEHWFAACLPQWAGLPIIDGKTNLDIGQFVADTAGAHAFLDRRDGKGILDHHLVRGAYGETTHQPALTEMLDLAYLCDPAQLDLADTVGFGPLLAACVLLLVRDCKQSPRNARKTSLSSVFTKPQGTAQSRRDSERNPTWSF